MANFVQENRFFLHKISHRILEGEIDSAILITTSQFLPDIKFNF